MDRPPNANNPHSLSTNITFLPVNQPGSPTDQRARRGYQSCDNCREKKKRCQPAYEGGKCWRCHLESRVCQITHKRKRRKLRPAAGDTAIVMSGMEQSQEITETDQGSDSHSATVPPGEEADNSTSQIGLAADHGHQHRSINAKEQILATNLLDARDALDLIAVAGSNDGSGDPSLSLAGQPLDQRPIAETTARVRPIVASVSAGWNQFFLIRRGVIRTSEAIEYLDFYFSHLWQLFPVVSQWYSFPDRYELLAAEEPVLTISLIATASRYHPLTGFNGHARSERIHWRTWPWVQRLLQSSIWGSSSMRRLGSIASLLLFIEWHPRAINSPEDLVSDVSEIELFDPQNTMDSMDSYRRSDLSSSSQSERLNIVAPAYRSNKMSWMLLSTAIALAQEQGCFDEEPILRSHTPPRGTSAPTSDSSNPVWQEWSRIICTFLRLTDEALALRLRLEPQLGSTSWTELVYRLPPSLTTDGILESAVDLATHMRKARELLLAWRKSEQGTAPAVSLAMWDTFKRGLDRWERQRQSNRPDPSLRGTCLDIEYYYVRLCGLSPAAHMFEKTTKTPHTSDAYTSSLSPCAEAATNASIDMLELTTRYFATPSSSVIFRHSPVRYWLYIFCASLYLLKATLRTEALITRSTPHINLILQVVNGIKYNAPDDIHMSQRYAELLEILINTALRPSQTDWYSNDHMSGGTGSSDRREFGDRPSLNRVQGDTILDAGNPPGMGEQWIYDSNFWDTLPDMVGLDSIPDLVLPCYE